MTDHHDRAVDLLHQAGIMRTASGAQVLATCAVAAALLSIDEKLARLVPAEPLDLRSKAGS